MPQSFFLKLLRQHSLSKRIEVECMCVFWVAVTASLNFFFTVAVVFSMVLRQHCFSKRIETVCVCVCGGVL